MRLTNQYSIPGNAVKIELNIAGEADSQIIKAMTLQEKIDLSQVIQQAEALTKEFFKDLKEKYTYLIPEADLAYSWKTRNHRRLKIKLTSIADSLEDISTEELFEYLESLKKFRNEISNLIGKADWILEAAAGRIGLLGDFAVESSTLYPAESRLWNIDMLSFNDINYVLDIHDPIPVIES